MCDARHGDRVTPLCACALVSVQPATPNLGDSRAVMDRQPQTFFGARSRKMILDGALPLWSDLVLSQEAGEGESMSENGFTTCPSTFEGRP